MTGKLSGFLFALCAGLLASVPLQAASWTEEQWSLSSPDERQRISVRRASGDGLEYRVAFNRDSRTETILDWSTLGLKVQRFNQQVLQLKPVISDFSRKLEFVSSTVSAGEDTYTMLTGKRLDNKATWRSLDITVRDPQTSLLLTVQLRAYNDGVAFRYRLPEESLFYYQVIEESTVFNVGEQADFWGQPYDFSTIFHPSYETAYLKVKSGTATPKDLGVGWGFPSLIQRNEVWALLHETNLDADFHGSHLQPVAAKGVYKIAPPTQDSAAGFGSNIAASTLPWDMPWRMFVVSDQLSHIVESNLVFHLAEPSKVTDTSWIEPGIASWSWWSDHNSSKNPQTLKKFIDFAQTMGWRYSLIDANWNLISENIMEELVAYAKERNVGLFFWYNSGGRHNFIGEQPRNRMDDRQIRRAEFAKLQKLGVKGIKVDFFQSDKQDIIRQYIELLEDAAEFHLLANFHGSTIPRGWERTWPNLMTMEAVRGGEFYSFSGEQSYGGQAPWQNALHPFLRNVIGSMDYTPVAFAEQPVKRFTSNAHEAALAVVFESGVQHIADSADSMLSLPEGYLDYFKKLPAVWHETRLLAGHPGEMAVLARRHGTTWYIAGINGEEKEKSLTLDLSVLPGVGTQGLFITDDASEPYHAKNITLEKLTDFPVVMKSWGGFVLRLEAQ